MFYMLDAVYNDLYEINAYMEERQLFIDENDIDGMKEWEYRFVPCWIPHDEDVPHDIDGERMYILYRIDI